MIIQAVRQNTAKRIAKGIAVTCDTNTIAAILDGLLCVEAESSLTDKEVEDCRALFDKLTELRHEAITMVMTCLTGPSGGAGEKR